MGTVFSLLRGLPSRLRRVTKSTAYVPQIDGLRFLAIMPVLFWHSGLRGIRYYEPDGSRSPLETLSIQWLPHGHVGVDLFFFISGYIIAYPFLAGHAPALGRFFGRRVLRIEPPYFLVMIGCFLALALSGYKPDHAPSFGRTDAPLWQSLAASMGYVHGVVFNAPPRLNPPAWSLEVEVQFYLIAPLVMIALNRIRSRPARRGVILCAAIVALIGSSAILGRDPHSLFQWTLICHAWPFLLGILICDYAAESSPIQKETHIGFDIALMIALIGMAISGHFEERVHGLWQYMARDGARAVCILAIYYGAFRGVVGRRVTGEPWVALIGGACYSIYLTHVPLMQAMSEIVFKFLHPSSLLEAWLLAFGVLIPASIAAGLIFYALIERPCTIPDWPRRALTALSRFSGKRRIAPNRSQA
jgi:peptidoglycan/LPS O-acetylase OafA/YrhL